MWLTSPLCCTSCKEESKEETRGFFAWESGIWSFDCPSILVSFSVFRKRKVRSFTVRFLAICMHMLVHSFNTYLLRGCFLAAIVLCLGVCFCVCVAKRTHKYHHFRYFSQCRSDLNHLNLRTGLPEQMMRDSESCTSLYQGQVLLALGLFLSCDYWQEMRVSVL